MQTIVGIDSLVGFEGGVRRRGIVGLLKRGTGGDQPMDGLEPPLMSNPLRRAPFQQVGMSGFFTVATEVVWGGHNAPAKVALPETVNDHSCQQGASSMGRIGDPPRQCRSSVLPGMAVRRGLKTPRGENTRKGEGDHLSRSVRIPSFEESHGGFDARQVSK